MHSALNQSTTFCYIIILCFQFSIYSVLQCNLLPSIYSYVVKIFVFSLHHYSIVYKIIAIKYYICTNNGYSCFTLIIVKDNYIGFSRSFNRLWAQTVNNNYFKTFKCVVTSCVQFYNTVYLFR